MEKISSILPSSPRVKSVDTKSLAPVRPGVPAMGRPEGRVSARDRLNVSAEAKDRALQDAFQGTMAARNPRDAQHVQIADSVTKKFFETRVPKIEDGPVETYVPSEPAAMEELPTADSPVKGSLLDTSA